MCRERRQLPSGAPTFRPGTPAGPVPAKPDAAPKPQPETPEQRNNTIDDLMNDPRTAAFLETLGWLESRGHYAVLNGNGKFSGYDRHPQIDTDAGKAAGAYQFKPKPGLAPPPAWA